MKQLLILAVLGAFGAGMIGCHASAGVDADSHGGTVAKRETTTVEGPGGTRTVETKVTNTP